MKKKERKITRSGFLGILDSLESSIKGLKWQFIRTEWGDYYKDTNYSDESFHQKKVLVSKFLDRTHAKIVWDLGANTGEFSRIACGKGMQTISFDIDPACVEKNYLECVMEKETKILPLLLDLTNPSSGLGWASQERMSFFERGPADAVEIRDTQRTLFIPHVKKEKRRI